MNKSEYNFDAYSFSKQSDYDEAKCERRSQRPCH